MTDRPPLGVSPDAAVRPARVADAPAVAAVHEQAWRASYGESLPGAVLDGLASASVDSWRAAITAAPTPFHRVFVSTAGDVVTGFAAVARSTDPDSGPMDVELVALEVDPLHRRTGHGSRLLNAAGDTARDTGARTLLAWCPAVDVERRRFLETAGFESDGAERVHDTGHGTEWPELRLTADLQPAGG